MNPRALLWLLLAGCAATGSGTACPAGHVVADHPGDRICGTCSYEYDAAKRSWSRKAASLDGFGHPASPVVREIHRRCDPRFVNYTQTHFPERTTESLWMRSDGNAWAKIVEALIALGAVGNAMDTDRIRHWKGDVQGSAVDVYVGNDSMIHVGVTTLIER